MACGSVFMTVNSPSGTILQCDTWLWDDMPLNRPVAAPCSVTRSSGIMTLNSPGGSTLQCGRWLWDDMPCNSPKHPPYRNSTSAFDFLTISQSTCHSAPVCKILCKSDHPQQKKSDVMSIFRMADPSHLGFLGVQ